MQKNKKKTREEVYLTQQFVLKIFYIFLYFRLNNVSVLHPTANSPPPRGQPVIENFFYYRGYLYSLQRTWNIQGVANRSNDRDFLPVPGFEIPVRVLDFFPVPGFEILVPGIFYCMADTILKAFSKSQTCVLWRGEFALLHAHSPILNLSLSTIFFVGIVHPTPL